MKKQLFIRKAMKADDENGMQASELSSSKYIHIDIMWCCDEKKSLNRPQM